MGQIVKTIDTIQLTSYDTIHKKERILPPNRERTNHLKQDLANDFTSLVQDDFFKKTFKTLLESDNPTLCINITIRKNVIKVTNKTTGRTTEFAIRQDAEMASTNRIISTIFTKALATVKSSSTSHQTQPGSLPQPQPTLAPSTIKNEPLKGLSTLPTPQSTSFSRPKSTSPKPAVRIGSPVKGKKGLSPLVIPPTASKISTPIHKHFQSAAPKIKKDHHPHTLHSSSSPSSFIEEYNAYPSFFSKDCNHPKQPKTKPADEFDPLNMLPSSHFPVIHSDDDDSPSICQTPLSSNSFASDTLDLHILEDSEDTELLSPKTPPSKPILVLRELE